MKMYRVTGIGWNTTIEELEIIKATNKTVTYLPKNQNKEWRENIVSSYQNWFETRDEAIDFIRETFRLKIARYQSQLDSLKGQSAEFENKLKSNK